MRRITATIVGIGLVMAAEHASGQCVGDANGDGTVRVNELVTAVNDSLNGCDFQSVTLNFAAKVGDAAFACGQQYSGLGTTAVTFIPADLRLYLSDVQLIGPDDRAVPIVLDQDELWQFENVVALDFEDKTPPCSLGTPQMNTTVRGRVPRGEYHGVRFVLGVPFSLNHLDTATSQSPLSLSAMFWSWQGGRKFLRIDEATDLFRVHVGSTQCESTIPTRPPTAPCGRPNRGEVILRNFNPATQTIVADLAALLASSDLEANQEETPPGCMSGFEDRDCEPLFQNLGINFDNGLPDASRQTFFRVE